MTLTEFENPWMNAMACSLSPCANHHKTRIAVDLPSYRPRTLVGRYFNNHKTVRLAATRYDKIADSFLSFIHTTPIRL